MRIQLHSRSYARRGWAVLCAAWICLASSQAVSFSSSEDPPTLEGVQALYYQGEYEKAAELAATAQELDPWISDWELIEAQSLLALGRYGDAYDSLSAYLNDRPYELRARLLLLEAARYTGRSAEFRRQLEMISFLINEAARRYAYNPDDIVAVGQAALLFRIDPKVVLENFFRRAQEEATPPASAYLAPGHLALSKHDYALASRTFQAGLERHPMNPELWYGLALSFTEDDRSKLVEYAEKALQLNPRHPETRVLLANHLIAAEAYAEAGEQLDRVLRVNSWHPAALAHKAVIAYLENDRAQGDAYRQQALAQWKTNPEVDHIIGRELSRKYRFEEGARSQRSALLLDPDYTVAQIQLALDLLRLGREDEAWDLAHTAHEADPYELVAYNLVTLHDKLEDFITLESENFRARLSKTEAPVYGERALRLLEEAYQRLSERWGIVLPQKTTVEIYPDPADFETRTFSMPGHGGFLGVCFGPVFTINSPATRAHNWEAVLFHEFCHTITLSMTNNRMPRWLSEGISVYEEVEANPAWGQRMTAGYRDRILQDRMLPIGDMSAAFLQAQSADDLQFAYYQSYLVVEYLVERYGLPRMRQLLLALGEGQHINEALAGTLDPLDELDLGFRASAKARASALASGFRFEEPARDRPLAVTLAGMDDQESYPERLGLATAALERRDWQEAAAQLESLIEQAGYVPGRENAHVLLATAYRELGDREREQSLLEEVAQREGNRLAPVTRLLELAQEEGDAAAALRWSEAWLAINPMGPTPWRALFQAASRLGRPEKAIEAGEALVALDPPDTAAILLALAQQRLPLDPLQSKRDLLLALESAPRNLEAYRLLQQIRHMPAPNREPPAPLDGFDPLDGFELFSPLAD